MKRENVETLSAVKIKINERRQHQQRSEQGVEKKLNRSVYTIRPTPHTDDQIHRDQGRFKKHVEQNRVQRRKRAVDQTGHDQKCGKILGDIFFDDLPSSDHD